MHKNYKKNILFYIQVGHVSLCFERKNPVRTVITAQRLVTTLYHQVKAWLKCAYELELEGL